MNFVSVDSAVLCQAVVGNSIALTKVTAMQELVSGEDSIRLWAIQNDVAPILGHQIADIIGRNQKSEFWYHSHESVMVRISNYLLELDRVADLLSQESIVIIALKNGGIARGIYSCPGCCPMGDLDLLVEKRHFRRAHQILLAHDYHFEFRSILEAAEIDEAEESGGAEYWKILSNGEKFWLELQWRPIAGRWIRPDQEPSAEELIVRSIPIDGTSVRLLSPEDNLLQVALHTAKHTYVRAPGFRLHLDVERIVRAYPNLNWNEFLERVTRLQVKTAVYFSLLIPFELFGTPIPQYVLDELRPVWWKRTLLRNWLQRVGLFNPHERKFSKLGYILFTILLYDDIVGLWRGIFPSRDWMEQVYGSKHSWELIYSYGHRIFDLAFRRLGT